MKILHTADWHLGKKLGRFSRLEEQALVLDEICEIADKEAVNVVVIAGDCFDTLNPPIDAIDLFYKSLKRLSDDGRRAVVAIAGNHDSPDRLEAPHPLAKECGIIFSGYPHSEISPYTLDTGLEVLQSEKGFLELKTPGSKTPLRLIHTPYANQQRLETSLGSSDDHDDVCQALQSHWSDIAKKYCNDEGINLLLTHLFFTKRGHEGIEDADDEKPILRVGGAKEMYSDMVPKGIDYVALGHLHRHHDIEGGPCPIIYSGSPLAYSMSEADQKKHVLILEKTDQEPLSYWSISLTQGRPCLRYSGSDIEDTVHWLSQNHHAYVELTMKTEQFLTVEERKQLMGAHPYLDIIPDVQGQTSISERKSIDLSQKMSVLFHDYFREKQGQEPNEDVMSLFQEIMGEPDDSD